MGFVLMESILEPSPKSQKIFAIVVNETVLSKNRNLGAQDLIDSVYGDLMDFLQGLPIHDDLTLLVIEKE